MPLSLPSEPLYDALAEMHKNAQKDSIANRIKSWRLERIIPFVSPGSISKVKKPGAFPYNTICQFDGNSVSFKGSGVAIKKNVILTAGHLFISDTTPYFDDYTVRQPNGHRVGLRKAASLLDVVIHPNWRDNDDPSFDIALCLIDSNFENTIDTTDLNNLETKVWVLGYPAAKFNKLHFSTGKIRDSLDSIVGYNALAAEGFSGGGGFTVIGNHSKLIATHIGGPNKASQKLTGDLFKGISYVENISSWISSTLDSFERQQNTNSGAVA